MKRIGIVTVYKSHNYGTKLQSYALQKKLDSLGFRGENLFAHPDNSKVSKNRIKRIIQTPSYSVDLIRKYMHRTEIRERRSIFNAYLSRFIIESKYRIEDLEKLTTVNENPYKKYICGSDQIWSPAQFSSDFFLGFVRNRNSKIAYAPSIGLSQIPAELKDSYRTLINSIEFVSVREEDGARLISDLTGREVPVVLDPTMLITADEWKTHLVKLDLDRPYIFCYFLGYDKSYRKWVEKLSERTGCPIVVLPSVNVSKDFSWGDRRIFKAGPREFLGLVDKASFVCTDSYHGVLISVNFNKDFFPFLRFKSDDSLNQNSRVTNFLSRIGLAERVVDPSKPIELEKIDWERVNRIIDAERTKSIEFLESALNN